MNDVRGWKWILFVAGLTVTLGACGPASSDDAAARLDPAGSGLPLAVRASLDSAGEALTAGDAVAARQYYRSALDEAPDLAAAWFGLYLAEHSLGNAAAADSALAAAKRAARADTTRSRPRSN